MHEYHIPVLAQESTELLAIRLDGTYADLTFGGGGHSSLILSQLGERGRLYSFDQDADAKANAARIEDSRFTFIESNFRFLRGSCVCAASRPSTACSPTSAYRPIISTRPNAVSRSVTTRRWTCA